MIPISGLFCSLGAAGGGGRSVIPISGLFCSLGAAVGGGRGDLWTVPKCLELGARALHLPRFILLLFIYLFKSLFTVGIKK